MLFPSILKSVGMRLRANCSLDAFLSPRIEEYTNYFVASGYDREEVRKTLEECRNVDREEFIQRPRKNKNRNGGPKKYVLCPKWDPRAPNVRDGLKLMEEVLYFNKENEKVFPGVLSLLDSEDRRMLGKWLPPPSPKGCQPLQVRRDASPAMHQEPVYCTRPEPCSRSVM